MKVYPDIVQVQDSTPPSSVEIEQSSLNTRTSLYKGFSLLGTQGGGKEHLVGDVLLEAFYSHVAHLLSELHPTSRPFLQSPDDVDVVHVSPIRGQMNIKIKEMIEEGETLINTISKYVYIKGMLKVQAKVAKEIEFLKNVEYNITEHLRDLATSFRDYFHAPNPENLWIRNPLECGDVQLTALSAEEQEALFGVTCDGSLKSFFQEYRLDQFWVKFDEGKNKEIKADHLASTNLHYFKALVSCLISCRNVVAVFQCFYLKTKDGTMKQIKVDIVSESGKVWIKVSARNPKALLQLSLGQGEYGQRSILDQAEDLVACASQCKHQFTPPLGLTALQVNMTQKFIQQLMIVINTNCSDRSPTN
uniref:DUF5614 domain-containing protein n=1 Tax=Timema genevievae TaxID=629358 RepID=A0A7R9JTM0_TIMGE|nr:unnamed protein product [Timema genevievae]